MHNQFIRRIVMSSLCSPPLLLEEQPPPSFVEDLHILEPRSTTYACPALSTATPFGCANVPGTSRCSPIRRTGFKSGENCGTRKFSESLTYNRPLTGRTLAAA